MLDSTRFALILAGSIVAIGLPFSIMLALVVSVWARRMQARERELRRQRPLVTWAR